MLKAPHTDTNRRVGAVLGLVAAGMLGMAYAAVPLYQLFCQMTGYGGTTQRVIKPSDTVLDRRVAIRLFAWHIEMERRIPSI